MSSRSSGCVPSLGACTFRNDVVCVDPWILKDSLTPRIAVVRTSDTSQGVPRAKAPPHVPSLPAGIRVWNPAFDVTPHELITGGIITELGVFAPEELRAALSASILEGQTLDSPQM